MSHLIDNDPSTPPQIPVYWAWKSQWSEIPDHLLEIAEQHSTRARCMFVLGIFAGDQLDESILRDEVRTDVTLAVQQSAAEILGESINVDRISIHHVSLDPDIESGDVPPPVEGEDYQFVDEPPEGDGDLES